MDKPWSEVNIISVLLCKCSWSIVYGQIDQLHLQSKTEILFTLDQGLAIYNEPATFAK
jgi:hypothetical protein